MPISRRGRVTNLPKTGGRHGPVRLAGRENREPHAARVEIYNGISVPAR